MKLKLFFTVLLLLFIWQGDAYAYINPGSGSEFFQILMSALLGIGSGIKKFFSAILGKNKDNKENYE